MFSSLDLAAEIRNFVRMITVRCLLYA